MLFIPTHELYDLLCHIRRLVELLLADLSGIQHLLNYLFRISIESLAELVEPVEKIAQIRKRTIRRLLVPERIEKRTGHLLFLPGRCLYDWRLRSIGFFRFCNLRQPILKLVSRDVISEINLWLLLWDALFRWCRHWRMNVLLLNPLRIIKHPQREWHPACVC